VPERFLGNWITKCKHLGRITDELYTRVVNAAIARREKRGSKDTFIDKVLDYKEYNFSFHELLYLTGSVLDAGTDTTAASVMNMIQLMCVYPDVLKRAQAEIDAVIGEERSPVWNDFANLPIINQLVKEGQRFRPVTPIGFPHKLDEGNRTYPPKSHFEHLITGH